MCRVLPKDRMPISDWLTTYEVNLPETIILQIVNSGIHDEYSTVTRDNGHWCYSAGVTGRRLPVKDCCMRVPVRIFFNRNASCQNKVEPKLSRVDLVRVHWFDHIAFQFT